MKRVRKDEKGGKTNHYTVSMTGLSRKLYSGAEKYCSTLHTRITIMTISMSFVKADARRCIYTNFIKNQ